MYAQRSLLGLWRGEVGKEKSLETGMCVDLGPVASQGNMPNRHLQRPQMDESAAAGRETLEERGRTVTGRASRPALVSRARRVQVRLLVVLVDGPV